MKMSDVAEFFPQGTFPETDLPPVRVSPTPYYSAREAERWSRGKDYAKGMRSMAKKRRDTKCGVSGSFGDVVEGYKYFCKRHGLQPGTQRDGYLK